MGACLRVNTTMPFHFWTIVFELCHVVKRSEKGVVSRLIRQTSCLFMEIPPRSLKTEFKCHLRLSNGHRAGGDPSKRLGDKRPLLNMAGAAGNVPRPASARKSASHWRDRSLPCHREKPGGRGPGPGSRVGVRVGSPGEGRGSSCKTTSYLPSPTRPCSPIPGDSAWKLGAFPPDFFLSVA